MEVNILGIPYEVKSLSENEDKRLEDLDGYTDVYSKLIVVENSRIGNIHNIIEHRRNVLRHEIVHAFLYESGMANCSSYSPCWAENEEMVDWIAIQGEKIYEAWKGTDALSAVTKNG